MVKPQHADRTQGSGSLSDPQLTSLPLRIESAGCVEDGRILIVEDQLIVAQDLLTLLQDKGLGPCKIAQSGEEALEYIDSDPPDVVLTDVNLGSGLDGIALGTHVREVSHAALIYMTAYSDDETLARARVTEPDGYLVKPLNPRGVYAMVSMAVYRSRSRRPRPRSFVTAREIQVIQCMSDGLSGKQIATALGISAKTVEFHRNSIYDKLGVRGAASVVRYAIKNGIVRP